MSKKDKKSGLLNRIIRLVGSVGSNVLFAWLFPIHADKCYGWAGGLWHGWIWFGNWVLSLFDHGRLLTAPLHTTAYTVWFWIALAPMIFWFVVLIIAILVLLVLSIFNRKKR